MGTIDLDGLELHPYRIPLRVRFRRTDLREGVLVRGPAGWGEFSPFPEYDDEYAARWLAAAVDAARNPLPPPVRDQVEVNTTIPAVGPERARELVAASGCRTAKVKVAEAGQSLEDDLARVAAVREALGPHGRLRVDANAAWDVATATDAITALAAHDLEYVEQPVPTLEEMAELRRRVDVPLAADESIRTAEDPLRIRDLDAADVLVLKVQPLGGVRRVLEIAERSGLPVVISSALETSVGLALGAAAAAALPDLPHACGLGTATLLSEDVAEPPLWPVDGSLAVGRVEPTIEALARVRPPENTCRAMIDRVHRAAAAAGRYR